ncbi:hypothetical protein D3C74_503860 [compost metagenome]
MPPLLSQVPEPLVKTTLPPLAAPRSTVNRNHPVHAASMALPGAVVQAAVVVLKWILGAVHVVA